MDRELVFEKLNELDSEEQFDLNRQKSVSYQGETEYRRLQEPGDGTPDILPHGQPVLIRMNGNDGETERSVRVRKLARDVPPCEYMYDSFELLYVLSGECRHSAFHRDIQMREGDLCFLSPLAPHSAVAAGESVVLRILVSGRAMEGIFAVTPPRSNVVSDFLRNSVFLKSYGSSLLFHTAGDEEIRGQLLDMCAEELAPDEYTDRMLTHMLMMLFVRLMRRYGDSAECPSGPSRGHGDGDTARILRYIQEHYATGSLAELAGLLNYSVPHCSKYVKACTGYSFSELQKRLRLRHASDCLRNTGVGIEQISERLGYSNPENFIRMFRKEYGVSPTQYRFGGGYN